MVSTSRIRGTFESVTGSWVSSVAARIGSAPFLLPAALIAPDRRRPPSITRACISSDVSAPAGRAEAGIAVG